MVKKHLRVSVYKVMAVSMALVVLIGMLTGCGREVEPVTAADFQSKMEELGYQVEDGTEHYAQFDHVEKCLAFASELEGGKMNVQFFEINTKENATGMFINNKEETIKKKSGVSSESSSSNNSYSEYKLTTGDTYYIVEQVGTTLIVARCPKAFKEKLDEVITAINY